jgi:Cft2 family RNA processing exonuclease
MSALEFRFVKGAIHLPALGLWLDAHRPVRGDEAVFVSHAHSDHTANHAHALFSPPTQMLMRARVAGKRKEQALEFSRRHMAADLGLRTSDFGLTLLPAGHIFGSAMSLIETADGSLLYTGDFKLRRSLTAEACAPCHADTLIMETTFGLPRYVLPPQPDIERGILEFCRDALADGVMPVLLGYSLGKSQEVLRLLGDAGLPAMLAAPAAKMTRVYAELGQTFGNWRPLEPQRAAGHVVICPPGAKLDGLRAKFPKLRTAVLTGWAMDSGCRYRYRADAAFPLSDHADFPDLIEFVQRVAPKRVFTLHGFATEFATTLRDLGVEAWALGEANQLTLPLK